MTDNNSLGPAKAERYREIASSVRALIPSMQYSEVRDELGVLALEYEKLARWLEALAESPGTRKLRSGQPSSSRSMIAERVTRPFCTDTPSACRRRACSPCSRDDLGNTMRPSAPTTRCHGRFSALGATRSANPAWRARPGSPAARATAP